MATKQIKKYTMPAELKQKLVTAIELKRQLAEFEDELKAELLEAMTKYDIKSISSDEYSVTRQSRASYSTEYLDLVPEEFVKEVLDTTKIGQYKKLYSELPAGVNETVKSFVAFRGKK